MTEITVFSEDSQSQTGRPSDDPKDQSRSLHPLIMNRHTLPKYLFSCALLLSLMLSASAMAQEAESDSTAAQPRDPVGDMDTLFVNVSRMDGNNWKMDIGYFSDVDLFGLSIPLAFKSGLRKVLVDSTSFKGGNAEHFKIKLVRPDTAIQRVTLGLIADLNPNAKTLDVGTGHIATIYLHAEGDKPAGPLTVDTTVTYPETHLLYVRNSKPPENKQTKIYPEFKFTTNEKVDKKSSGM